MKTIYHPGYRRLMGKLRAARKAASLRLVDAARMMGRGKDWLHRVETSQVRLDVLLVRAALQRPQPQLPGLAGGAGRVV